jgi:sodium transport system ATP-binding protein
MKAKLLDSLAQMGQVKLPLLRLLAGVYTPTDGAVVLSDGSKVEDARHRLGVVPESTGLYSRLTAWENIRYHSRLYGTSDEESWNRTVFFADRLDMKESLGRHTKGLLKRNAAKNGTAQGTCTCTRHSSFG